MIEICKACDEGRHDDCSGTVTFIEQDGPNAYICECWHRREVLEQVRVKLAEGRVRKLMRELRLDSTHELVRKGAKR